MKSTSPRANKTTHTTPAFKDEFLTTDKTPVSQVENFCKTSRRQRQDFLSRVAVAQESPNKANFGRGRGQIGTAANWMFRDEPKISLCNTERLMTESDKGATRANLFEYRSDYLYDKSRRSPRRREASEIRAKSSWTLQKERSRRESKMRKAAEQCLLQVPSPRQAIGKEFFSNNRGGQCPLASELQPKFTSGQKRVVVSYF